VLLSAVFALLRSEASADISIERGVGSIVRVYLEGAAEQPGTVHAVLRDGRDIKISRPNDWRPRLAADGRTVGWFTCVPDARVEWVADGLQIYRPGRRRWIAADVFGRSWQFWNGGQSVAFYDGGGHGMGRYRLLDVDSGKQLAEVGDRDLYRDGKLIASPPDWTRTLVP
jgi:hypothetical protein